MTIFKNYTFSWKQMAVFKICLLCIGVAVGSHWHDAFAPYVVLLLVAGLILGLYLALVAMKQ